MIALRLTRLIETHSEEITKNLVKVIRNSPRTRGMRNISDLELRAGTMEVLQHLREWLLTKTDTDIQGHYRQIGAQRAWQGATLPEACWVLLLTKDYLWRFLQRQAIVGSGAAIYGEVELLLSINHFFDRALCHLIEGYEENEQLGGKPEARTWPEANIAAWVP